MGALGGQAKVSSGWQSELQGAREEATALKGALEAAASQHERDAAAVQAKLSAALKDVDKWRQLAGKYQRQMEDLQRDLQQQSKQWQKTAEIQGNPRRRCAPGPASRRRRFWALHSRRAAVRAGGV